MTKCSHQGCLMLQACGSLARPTPRGAPGAHLFSAPLGQTPACTCYQLIHLQQACPGPCISDRRACAAAACLSLPCPLTEKYICLQSLAPIYGPQSNLKVRLLPCLPRQSEVGPSEPPKASLPQRQGSQLEPAGGNLAGGLHAVEPVEDSLEGLPMEPPVYFEIPPSYELPPEEAHDKEEQQENLTLDPYAGV